MRLLKTLIPLFFLGILHAPSMSAAEAIRHRFLCCDYAGGQVCIVGADGKLEWRFEARQPQDCWVLPNGNILFAYRNGAKEVTLAKEVVWEYTAPESVEVHSAQPLPDGNVLVVECGTKRLIEVDRAGKVAREVPLVPGPKVGTHGQFRGARKLGNGNYVVTYMSDRKVAEVDPTGRVVREQAVPGNPHEIVPLKNGNWLVTCGDGHQVIELNAKGDVVWTVQENDLPENPLRLMAGIQRLPNGNTILCNWLGHGHIGKNPHLYEVKPDKQLVWSYADHQLFKTINQIQVLDDAALGKPWELER
jgi:outer membrane protein assembly factor BamB